MNATTFVHEELGGRELATAHPNHYQVRVRCGNCTAHLTAIVPKGMTVASALSTRKCIECGVADLVKLVKS